MNWTTIGERVTANMITIAILLGIATRLTIQIDREPLGAEFKYDVRLRRT